MSKPIQPSVVSNIAYQVILEMGQYRFLNHLEDAVKQNVKIWWERTHLTTSLPVEGFNHRLISWCDTSWFTVHTSMMHKPIGEWLHNISFLLTESGISVVNINYGAWSLIFRIKTERSSVNGIVYHMACILPRQQQPCKKMKRSTNSCIINFDLKNCEFSQGKQNCLMLNIRGIWDITLLSQFSFIGIIHVCTNPT